MESVRRWYHGVLVLFVVVAVGPMLQPAGSQVLKAAAMAVIVGGNACGGFFGGLSLGLDISAFFGCVPCAVGGIGAGLIAAACEIWG